MTPNSRYTATVGKKFHQDGTVRHYPGNTIICYCDPDENAYAQAEWVQQRLMACAFAPKFTLLPLSSMHMTVIQLLCDQARKPEKWSSKLALDAPLMETDTFFLDTVPKVLTPRNFRMAFKLLWQSSSGISIRLQPADDASHKAIWRYRHAIAQATGVRFPDHDQYEFHISLAYQIMELDAAETDGMQAFRQQVDTHLRQHFDIFDTGEPYLTFFDDMFAFVTADERHKLKSRQELAP